ALLHVALAPLGDAGALADPLVGSVHHPLEILVREPPGGHARAGPGDANAERRRGRRERADAGAHAVCLRAAPGRMVGEGVTPASSPPPMSVSTSARRLTIASLTRRATRSLALRMAAAMVRACDDPWQITQMPLTPSSGAPPYSW